MLTAPMMGPASNTTSSPAPQHNDALLAPPYTSQTAAVPMRRPKRVLGTARRIACCIVPRDGHNTLIISVLVLLPVVVFLTSVVPSTDIVSFIVVPILTLVTLLVLMLSVTIDPGILIPVLPDPQRAPEVVNVNGALIECKVCTTCNIVRPPRSSHCHGCDWCVEEFDHHCGVIGSCVAKRTFRFFAGFLFGATTTAAYIVVRSILLLIDMNFDNELGTNEGRWKVVATFGCTLYCIVGGCCISGQCGFYAYLGCANKTQKECNNKAHGHVSGPINPFDEGGCTNCWKRFFAPLSTSRINKNTPEYV